MAEQGTIKKLTDKGFGFISREGQSDDLFFHASNMRSGHEYSRLAEGQAVEFQEGQGERGPRAEDVRPS